MKPARSNFTIIKQICELIPGHLVNKLAKEYGVDKRSRKITPWSHVVALVYAQVSHALGLNDVCDALRNQSSKVMGQQEACLEHARNRNRHIYRD